MRFIKKLLIALVLLALVMLVVGFFLPSTTKVNRSVSINAPAAKVFSYINSFEQFNRWSPWYGIDPQATTTYSGPANGEGAKMTWVSENPQVGSGSQEITQSIPNSLVETRLDFGEQGGAEATFMIEQSGEVSNLTWGFESDWGYNIMGRYIGLMMDGMVGEKYEVGLAKLKLLAESE